MMSIENALHSQQVYDPTDDSIMAEQELCMERLYDYNHTRPSEHTKRERLLKKMLAECGAGCWIEPPFHAKMSCSSIDFDIIKILAWNVVSENFLPKRVFNLTIRRFLRFTGGQTSDIAHFCREEQILVKMRFVHKKSVNAQLFKGDNIILALIGAQLF